MTNKVNSGNNQFIEAIIQAYLKVPEIPPEKLENHAGILTDLILSAFSNELKSNQAFSLPYKDITDIVFYSNHKLFSDSIYNFRQNIEKSIDSHYFINLDKHHNTRKKYVKRFMHIHDKLVEHTLLAQAQRDFIEHTVNKIKDITTAETQTIVSELKITAKNANLIAKNAEETAKKAEETYKSMFANYVTILGIFTAIIVTIFGGLNVISVVMKNNLRLSLLVILVSILFLCLTTLLYFLANIITWITSTRDTSITKIFTVIVLVCIASMIAGLVLYSFTKI